MKEEDLLKVIKEKNVKILRLQFTDLDGTLKQVSVPTSDIKRVLDGKVMFDGSSVEGFARIQESDMYLRPDLSTFTLIPWEDSKSARIICDVMEPDGRECEESPRYILKKVVNEARKMGFEAQAGPEPEFFIFEADGDNPREALVDSGSYFDMLPLSRSELVRREVVQDLEEMGFQVEADHHEVSPSQHEIDFRYADILTTADRVQTFKLVVKTVALKNGLRATFMPKPIEGINGSGMHVHISLFKDGQNAFYDPKGEYELSEVFMHFVAGLMEHSRYITAITNPTVNSYKRLVPGYEAPVNVAWAVSNRSALIRIPQARGERTRLEYRSPDSSCNAYLAFAVILASGLDGLKRNLTPPKPINKNIFKMSDSEKRGNKIKSLPSNLMEALELAKKDKLVVDTLGQKAFEIFVRMKETEWKRFSTAVTNWEIKEYFENV
ncbi:type I glutamate--ammonia ligase [Athalassotoga saccharophila]|uniref:type I glutamate--ammonia ligase n=1 Tax=Athalassotoga saccharophila TaxID=1441386 RepID=UPI00137A522B|nr:type I glutamate--ammonia ligase [Athalassotoga saccharophila]BBJ29034.1 glutamine synthetase [Athalassotoga saccharophila]